MRITAKGYNLNTNNRCITHARTRVYIIIKSSIDNLNKIIMKTIIVGIDQTTGIKVTEALFVNNNSAIENLVNYFLQGMGMQLSLIEQREKIKKNIVCVNNRSALIERNGIDYIATRRDENNKPLPNSDEKTLLADEKSAKFYINKFAVIK